MGNWEITSYNEVIYDGTTNKFVLNSGSASFKEIEKAKSGQVEMNWSATHENDTASFDFSGVFEQSSADKLLFSNGQDTIEVSISRQLKKDMTIEMVVNPNRKSIVILKKK